MKVPLLDLKPPLKDLRDEIVETVTRVIDSTHYIMGPEIDELEKEIAEYCVRDVVATTRLYEIWRDRLAGVK